MKLSIADLVVDVDPWEVAVMEIVEKMENAVVEEDNIPVEEVFQKELVGSILVEEVFQTELMGSILVGVVFQVVLVDNILAVVADIAHIVVHHMVAVRLVGDSWDIHRIAVVEGGIVLAGDNNLVVQEAVVDNIRELQEKVGEDNIVDEVHQVQEAVVKMVIAVGT
jgi:hypothetical protein